MRSRSPRNERIVEEAIDFYMAGSRRATVLPIAVNSVSPGDWISGLCCSVCEITKCIIAADRRRISRLALRESGEVSLGRVGETALDTPDLVSALSLPDWRHRFPWRRLFRLKIRLLTLKRRRLCCLALLDQDIASARPSSGLRPSGSPLEALPMKITSALRSSHGP